MGKFAVVVMLPDDPTDPHRVDFQHREFDSFEQILDDMHKLDEIFPKWQLVSFCHVEDLPLLMEPPKPPDNIVS